MALPAYAQNPLDHRELAADQQIIHALNRLTFGARPGDIQQIRSVGLDKWVEQQLHPERIDNSSLEKFVARYSILKQDQNVSASRVQRGAAGAPRCTARSW